MPKKRTTKVSQSSLPTRQASFRPVLTNAEALAQFSETEQRNDNGANNYLPTFLQLAEKITKEYRQYDIHTFLFHNQSLEIPTKELMRLYKKFTDAMLGFGKVTVIPSLVYDTESFCVVG